MEIKRVTCGHCYAQCGLIVHVENGKAVKVQGDPEHIISRGFICKKGLASLEYFYHPDRLHYPMKRFGNRGEAKWKRLSTDEALDEIAEKLKGLEEKYRPESLAWCTGTYHGPDCAMEIRFLNLFGSPNFTGPGIPCAGPALEAEAITYGFGPTGAGFPPPEPGKTKCIVIWGHRPKTSVPSFWQIIRRCKEAGTKLIVIDPFCTEEASNAHIWLQLRPGTDGALALGWLNVIIEEDLYDKDFVQNWTVGFQELKGRLKEYTPEKVAKITHLSKDQIIESAKMYATHRPAFLSWGLACAQIGRNVLPLERAKAILRAITSNLDVEGGMVLSGPHPKILSNPEMELHDQLPLEQRKKRLGSDRFKLHGEGYQMITEAMRRVWYNKRHILSGIWAQAAHTPTLWRAIITGKPYPIKALMISYNNALGCYSNLKLVYEALKSPNLELLVVRELFMTPTAELADYVLPACHWLEKSNLCTFWGWSNMAIASERALVPQYEHLTEYDFLRSLGIRLGQAEYWPETTEGLWDEMLKPVGLTFEEMLKRRWVVGPIRYKKYEELSPDIGKPIGFGTPSGKVEIYSSILGKLGYDPLPYYEEPRESPISGPELAKKYPLILITGGTKEESHHQDHRQITTLRKKSPDPLMQIHPDTANKLGIEDGEWVYIENIRGKVRQKAEVTDRIAPGVVQADRWWYPELPGEEPSLHGVWISNINILTDDDPDSCDQAYGSWPYRALLCKVYKAMD